MTPEMATAIVNWVAMCHPKFKALQVTADSTNGKVTFKECPVDPRRIAEWFEDSGAYVVQTGYNVGKDEWFTYFREVAK